MVLLYSDMLVLTCTRCCWLGWGFFHCRPAIWVLPRPSLCQRILWMLVYISVVFGFKHFPWVQRRIGVWFPCSFMHVPDFMAALAVIFCCLLFQAFSLIQWLLWWLVLCCRCTYQLYSQPMQYSRIYAACLLICAYYIDIIHSFFSQHVTVLVALSVLPPVLLITGFCVVNLLQRNNHRLKLFD